MTGWKIFSHSVFLLKSNFKDAVRISSPLIAVMLLGFVLVGPKSYVGTSAGGAGQGIEIVLQLLSAIAGLWVAVAWHRYVLLEEDEGGLPAFHGGRMMAYLGAILILSLTLMLISVLLGFIVGFLTAAFQPLFWAGIIAISILGIWVFYRLSPMLPGAAVGKWIGFSKSWETTSDISGPIMSAVFFYVLSAFVLGTFVALAMYVNFFVGAMVIVLMQLVYTLIGVSILTTIYGVSVEGRPID